MQTDFIPNYIQFDNLNPDIEYLYNTDNSIDNIDYSFAGSPACDSCIEKNLGLSDFDINSDDLIIIGIVIFFLIEGSIDIATIVSLGLLLFSNNS